MAQTAELREWLLLCAAVLVVLALLYLLRPRRRQIRVPFGGLWQQVLAQAEARALGRRWRRWLSFLLMATIAGLLLLARGEALVGLSGCSEPPEAGSTHTVILIDTSASMGTVDGRPTPEQALGRQRVPRIEEALAAAREVVQAARPRERMLVMTASSRLRTRSGWTSDVGALTHALGGIEAGHAGLDLARALAAARDSLAGRAGARVVLITDGGPPVAPTTVPPDLPLEVIAVGQVARSDLSAGAPPVDNVAVEQVGVRALPADPGVGVLSVRLRNDRAVPTAVRVLVSAAPDGRSAADFSGNQALRTLREETLQPQSSRWLQIDKVDLSLGRFSVRVQPAEGADWRDVAPWDDHGYAVLAERKQLRVLLVGEPNLFLEAALLANPRVLLQSVTPADYLPGAYLASERGRHRVDLVVLHAVAAPAPEGMPVLRFDGVAHPDAAPGDQIAPVPDLEVRPPEHPVTRSLSFQDANLDEVRILRGGASDLELVRARGRPGGPAVLATSQGVRAVHVGFDLLSTDLIGRTFLPLFMANAVDWLAGEEEALLSPLEVGRVWAVQAPTSGQRWSLRVPGRAPVPARVSGDQLIASSEVHGIHEWRSEEGMVLARPTRLPPTERPAARTPPGEPWRAPPLVDQARHQPQPPPVWLWLLLAAALLLTLEWALYVRRRTV